MRSITSTHLFRAVAIGWLVVAAGAVAPAAAIADGGLQTIAPTRLAQAAPRAGAPQREAQPSQPPAQPQTGAKEVDREIADLRGRLKITPAQQPQFEALAQVMRQNADAMEAAARQAQQNRSQSAVDEVRAASRFAEADAEGLKRLLPPLEALYSSLSDQQKHVADQVFSNAPPPEQPQGGRR